MKKVIIALLSIAAAASPIAATSAEAQQRPNGPGGPGGPGHGPAARPGPARPGPAHGPAARPQPPHAVAPHASAARRWNKGQRFDRRYASNYQEISDWRQYRGRRLYAPPRGYHWVRSGNDAVLVALTGGLIGAVLGGAFN